MKLSEISEIVIQHSELLATLDADDDCEIDLKREVHDKMVTILKKEYPCDWDGEVLDRAEYLLIPIIHKLTAIDYAMYPTHEHGTILFERGISTNGKVASACPSQKFQAAADDFELLKALYENGFAPASFHLPAAVGVGNIDCLRFIFERYQFSKDEDEKRLTWQRMCNVADVECFEYLFERGYYQVFPLCPPSLSMCFYIGSDFMKCVHYLLNKGYVLKSYTSFQAFQADIQRMSINSLIHLEFACPHT